MTRGGFDRGKKIASSFSFLSFLAPPVPTGFTRLRRGRFIICDSEMLAIWQEGSPSNRDALMHKRLSGDSTWQARAQCQNP